MMLSPVSENVFEAPPEYNACEIKTSSTELFNEGKVKILGIILVNFLE